VVLFVFLRAVYIRKYYKFKNSEAAKKFIETVTYSLMNIIISIISQIYPQT